MKYKVTYCTGEIVSVDEIQLESVYANGDTKPVFRIDRINTCDHECEYHAKEKTHPA